MSCRNLSLLQYNNTQIEASLTSFSHYFVYLIAFRADLSRSLHYSTLIRSHLILSYLISSHLISSHLISSYLISLPSTIPFSGKLGRPVIQIEGVTFGYASKNESKNPSLPLFADVHLGIEQSSRIALVGPNGSGKVTIANFIIVSSSCIISCQ